MTPTELLTRASSDFSVMYLDAPTQGRLLLKSLAAYQEKVGPIEKLIFPDAEVEADKPEGFLSIAIAMDADSVFHEASETATKVVIAAQDYSVKPFYCWYFQNFQEWDLDEDLPAESIYLISTYLTALIDVLNSERGRGAAMATGLPLEFPSDQELRERLDAAAVAMEENQAIFPGVVVM